MSDCEAYRMRPCPFCGSEVLHVESWARSFKPPRLYHEWHHLDQDVACWAFRNRGTIIESADETGDSQLAALTRWNARS